MFCLNERLSRGGDFIVTTHFFHHYPLNQFTIYNSQFTIHNLQFTIYNSQFTIHNLQFTIYNFYFPQI